MALTPFLEGYLDKVEWWIIERIGKNVASPLINIEGYIIDLKLPVDYLQWLGSKHVFEISSFDVNKDNQLVGVELTYIRPED